MESNIHFVTDLVEFLQTVLVTINSEFHNQIFICGTFDHSLFKIITDMLLEHNKINTCKILIPHIASTGIASRSYINKLSNFGGEIRLNSTFRKNLVVIGKDAFILSLSSRYVQGQVIKSNFDCAVHTNDIKTVNHIYELFEEIWGKSLPILSA